MIYELIFPLLEFWFTFCFISTCMLACLGSSMFVAFKFLWLVEFRQHGQKKTYIVGNLERNIKGEKLQAQKAKGGGRFN